MVEALDPLYRLQSGGDPPAWGLQCENALKDEKADSYTTSASDPQFCLELGGDPCGPGAYWGKLEDPGNQA